ncbi:MAG: hypothetical protein L0323_01935 [Planctomycetes bacterium]|nr:hypothetical protein [Planctomycetota bacterium]
MPSTRFSRLPATALGLLPLAAAPGPAQIPLGGIGAGAFRDGAFPGGLALVDPIPATTTLLTGLPCIEANSIAIDPYDPTKLLVGGIDPGGSACPSTGTISELLLSGTAVTGSTVVATLPSQASVSDLVLDDDGNLFASSGASVYKVDRATGGSVLVATGFGGGAVANALAYDPVGNDLYVGVMGVGFVVHVDPETGTLTPLNAASVATVTGSSTISGLTLSEDRTKVYACTFGPGFPGGPSGLTWIVVLPTDPALWPAPPVPLDVTPAIGSLSPPNDLEIQGTKMFTVSATNMDTIFVIDLSLGPPHPAVALPYFPGGIGASFGVPSQLAVNEFEDDLTVFPRRPSAGTTATFRFALGGPPGDLGVIGVFGYDPDGPGPAPLVVDPLVLGLGLFVGPAGNLSLPPLDVPIGLGTSGIVITLASARISGGMLVNLDLSAATVEIQ